MTTASPTTLLSEVIDTILDTGSATMTLDGDDAELLAAVVDSAPAFFERDLDRKLRHSGTDANFGFRRMGIEHSVTAERPDVNESLTLWADRIDLVENHDEVGPLLDHMVRWQTRLSELVADLFDGFVTALGGELPEPVAFTRASHLQVNSSLSAPAHRPLLQDCHEDGHLVTVLHANAAGLEIGCNRTATSVELRPDEILVMPGSLLTIVSDGRVEPLFHQVRNHGPSQVGRISVMYFVNPQLDRPTYPWTSSSTQPTDLRDTIRDRPGDFGLPVVPDI